MYELFYTQFVMRKDDRGQVGELGPYRGGAMQRHHNSFAHAPMNRTFHSLKACNWSTPGFDYAKAI